MFDALERDHRAAGRTLWATPRSRDFAGWLREGYLRAQLDQSITARLLSEAEERELWRGIVAASDVGGGLLDPAAAASAARRARHALFEYAIPVHLLERDPSAETQAFLQWNAAFEHRCRELHCVGAESLIADPAPGTEAIAWIESPAWRPAARRWLAARGKTLAPQAVTGGNARSLQAAAAPDELAAVAAWAKDALERDATFRAWIRIAGLNSRRAEVADAFDAALAPRRFDLRPFREAPAYAIAGGQPLGNYAPVRAALALLAASVGPIPFRQFSALLRAPELHASGEAGSQAMQLDARLRGRAPDRADFRTYLRLAYELARLQGLQVDALQRLDTAVGLLDRHTGAHAYSTWVRAWVGAFEAAPWNFRARWSSVEFQAAERFRELLGALAPADDIFGSCNHADAQRILERSVHDTAFQERTGVPPIWISGQTMDPWLAYDGIWISGCDNTHWPAPQRMLPFIPVQLQRDFGVAGSVSHLQLQLAIDLQRRWQSRAFQCVFSHASLLHESSSMSALLPRQHTLDFGSVSAPQPHWQHQHQAAPSLERLQDERAPRFDAGERTRGAATLRDQSRCAFRGFAHTRLKTERLELPEPGYSERERGELAHQALHHVWLQLRDSSALQRLSAAGEDALLDAASVAAIEAMRRRSRDPGTLWRRREHQRLRRLLGMWLSVERGRATFTVDALERAAQVQLANLDFRVRIDREDLLEDGARVLIDYKSGAAERDWRGERPDNPQLPLYALLRPAGLVAVAYGRVNAAEPQFQYESERRDTFCAGARASSLEGMANFAVLVELWRDRLWALADQFAAGRAEVAPTPTACRSCDLHALCRVPSALQEAGSADA